MSGHQCTRGRSPGVRQFEDLSVEVGLLEFVRRFPARDRDGSGARRVRCPIYALRAQSGSARSLPSRRRSPSMARRRLAQRADRLLKGGVAACIVPGVEIGEAIQHRVVADRIVEQVGDAEIESTATGEHFAPYAVRERVRGRSWFSRATGAKAMRTCIGPPVRTGFRSAKSWRPRGTVPMKSSNISLDARSVLACRKRSA